MFIALFSLAISYSVVLLLLLTVSFVGDFQLSFCLLFIGENIQTYLKKNITTLEKAPTIKIMKTLEGVSYAKQRIT